MYLLEREDRELDVAWKLLIDKGFNPVHWMYMHSTPSAHHFKNSVSRNYIVIDKFPQDFNPLGKDGPA